MALIKCESCGKFFGQDNAEKLCSQCRDTGKKKAVLTGDIEHDKFTNARAVVYDMPHISPKELTEELIARGVPITIQEVMRYVTEGRLQLVTAEGGNYCNSCGTSIGMGTLCGNCSKKLEKFRKSPIVKEKPESKKTGSKMHTQK